MYKYSVLTYNIGGYELLHEINKDAISDEIEYIYVTDDKTITSSTWNVKYVELEGDNFDKCYQIRFNPFDYTTTDIVMRIDGSMGIEKDLTPIFKYFEEGEYDIALMSHPTRMNLYDEYVAWVQQRNYPIEQANKCLSFMAMMEGYDVKGNVGMYQYNFMIQRRNRINYDLNRLTFAYLKYLAPDGSTIDRLDQTIGSFVINKYFSKMKAFCVGQHLCASGSYFIWYAHNSNTPMVCDNFNYCTPYMMGKEIYYAPLW